MILPSYRHAGEHLIRVGGAVLWLLVSAGQTQSAHAQGDTAAGLRPLHDLTDPRGILAQKLVLSNPGIVRRVTDSANGKPLRSAVFRVHPAGPGDITESSRSCAGSICYRVDIYNYAFNATFSVMVDTARRRVVSAGAYQRGQPELPDYLVQRALEIAVEAPGVEAALGFKPEKDRALMANVKTALNDTECESSRHLCVAPTFVFERAERALWAIVDLTDERLVGVRWTDIGAAKMIRPTEQMIQRERVYEDFCAEKSTFTRGDWRFDYVITGSDGLGISDVRYRGDKVLDSAKLVDWHVSYSERDGFGYSDAVGCPVFSSAAVGALEGPGVEPIEGGGFAFVQDFHHPLWPAPCNYRYKQRFEFYADGRFRIAAGQYGRGCGVDGMYRPVLRIEPALDGRAGFSEWDGESWKPWKQEQWRLQNADTRYSEQGYQYRITGGGKGWYLEPGTGQFPHNRGDHAYVYVTRDNAGEGDADLVTIGPCCNTDHRQGPEQFIGDPPETLDGPGFVVWYVPQLANDERTGSMYCWAETSVIDGVYQPQSWPCYGGPMFVPVESVLE